MIIGIKRSLMNTRERIKAVFDFTTPDRLPVIEWAGWWDKTIERWRSEGLPSNLDRQDTYRYFNMDVHYQYHVRQIDEGCPSPAEEGAPLIKSIDDYLEIKKYLYPVHLLDLARWEEWAEKQRRGDAALWFSLQGFFWFPRTLLGIEPHLYSFYDNPELLHMINKDNSEYHNKVIDKIFSICTPDFMTFAEDMSYNNGPMLSKDCFDEFMKPYYAKVISRLKERGTKIIIDSDGDISTPAYWFEEAGLEGILPLERQAGVDVSELRRQHPRQIYVGAFDKMVMNKGEDAMRAEFERLLPVAKKGGFLISCDHQTPPGVSLEDYKQYLRLFSEYADKAAEQ